MIGPFATGKKRLNLAVNDTVFLELSLLGRAQRLAQRLVSKSSGQYSEIIMIHSGSDSHVSPCRLAAAQFGTLSRSISRTQQGHSRTMGRRFGFILRFTLQLIRLFIRIIADQTGQNRNREPSSSTAERAGEPSRISG